MAYAVEYRAFKERIPATAGKRRRTTKGPDDVSSSSGARPKRTFEAKPLPDELDLSVLRASVPPDSGITFAHDPLEKRLRVVHNDGMGGVQRFSSAFQKYGAAESSRRCLFWAWRELERLGLKCPLEGFMDNVPEGMEL